MSNSAGATLDLISVTKRYADQVAVDDVSFSVGSGEFVTLLGPSGSGKTTTLNMVAGFAGLTSGEITMDNRSLIHLPPYKRGIGVVFQHYALFPHMTVAQNVAFPLRQRRMPRAAIATRVDEVLALVAMAGFGHRYPRQISGGQQQRVAVARAIAAQPRLLLMDEPLGALDKNLRQSLQNEISRLHRELGVTVVYVTHDQDEAVALSDRIAVFNNGRIEQIGNPKQLYERPSTLFVANFLGESNVFHGRLDAASSMVHTSVGPVRAATALAATAVDHVGGTNVVVRPERCLVRRTNDGVDPDMNAVSGTVHRVVYLGASRRIEVRLPDGQIAVSRRPHDAGDHGVVGDDVLFAWRSSDSVLLPAALAGQ